MLGTEPAIRARIHELTGTAAPAATSGGTRPSTTTDNGRAARQLDGLQDEVQEAQEPRLGFEFSGEQLAGAWCGGGSLMTEIRKSAVVKASVIACSGRCQ
jgi:hypothetical protein